jgi:integrase
MINRLNKKYDPYIFNPNPKCCQDMLRRARERLAAQLGNPRLKQIHYHTFRHWKGTVTYHKTRDLLYVKQVLGHKSVMNTEIYTHIIDFESDEYSSATAKTVGDAQKLWNQDLNT